MNSEEISRYSGHINLEAIGREGQERAAGSAVLIAGCGGLGSPVALYLAAAGVGRIGLIDGDTVALSNLQRQIVHSTADLNRPKTASAADKMRAVNPGIIVETMDFRLTAENGRSVIDSYDVIVDCTDSLASRLLVNDLCVASRKRYVFGSVGGFGGMLFTYIPGHSDYRTFFDATVPDDGAQARSDSASGVFSATVGVVGSLMAGETLKLLTGAGIPLTDRLLTVDLLTMTTNEFRISGSHDA